MSKDELDFDPSIPEDERRFYLKAYPNVNHVRERKVHCTICKMHIGTAPSNESIIRMHPILRVTHCKKCHEFYNSGEFSKGEDGSELYCRWCGQGGEVYCCSNCPYVFCKSCIISNLSRGVVADIEQNENWSCFNCAPKMLWPLRAQHWALIKFIDKQKKAILSSNLTDSEIKIQMTKDRSLCCKIKKVGGGYGTDSSDSSDISLSRLKKKAGDKRSRKSLSKEDLTGGASPAQAKKLKNNDNDVVCTPDVLSMLEPECTLTVPAKSPANAQPSTPTPKIMSIQAAPPKRPTPTPPLILRNVQQPLLRPAPPTQVLKKTVVGPRMPAGGQSSDFTTPVYHTINGYRIDLNSAAQQETVRLPNGKLIQVKRQGTGPQQVTTVQNAPNQHSTPTRVIHNIATPSVSPITSGPSQQVVHSSGGHIIRAQLQAPRPVVMPTMQNNSLGSQYQQQLQQQQQQQQPTQPHYQQITIRQPQIATIRYQGNTAPQMSNMIPNGTMQILNGTQVTTTGSGQQLPSIRPVPTFIKQLFPNTPLGQSRTQLQNQIFNAMEICQHLMGKLQTLTNSNAYKTAKSMTDVKELYIHLSYLLTYAIGRFKGLQDNCLADMRDLGFTNDANSLENGQLAAEKQASDAEEDEITIVEPKTDTINLDSDNEDDLPSPPPKKPNGNGPMQSAVRNNNSHIASQQPANQVNQSNMSMAEQHVTPTTTTNEDDEITAEYDFSKVASLLAGMLEVELTEGGTECVQQPKKPRKKTTHKPNPTLVKQKEMQERERLENIKKNCIKLKMEVEIPLNRVEEIYQYAKPMLEELKLEKLKAEEMDVSKKENEMKKKELEELGDEKIEGESTKANDITPETCSEKENETDDKDESEEVVVVLVEESDNPKEDEEAEKATPTEADKGEGDVSVELIDQDETPESDRDAVEEEEDSVHPVESAKVDEKSKEEEEDVDKSKEDDEVNEIEDKEKEKEKEEEKDEEMDEDKEEDESVEKEEDEEKEEDKEKENEEIIENEDEDKTKEDEEENENEDEVIHMKEPQLFADDIDDEELELSINNELNKSSELPLNTTEADPMDIDIDPPKIDDSDKDMMEVLQVSQNEDDKEVDEKNLDTSSLSHNYKEILGRTEVV